MDTFVCYACLICLNFGYMSAKVESALFLTDHACDDVSNFLFQYKPLSLQEAFTKEESVKDVLSSGNSARISGYAVLSPKYTFTGCIQRSLFLNNNTNSVKTFTNQPKGSLYNCFRGCAAVSTETDNLHVGLSNTTCYCMKKRPSEFLVENKYCNENRTDIPSYISVFNTKAGITYTDVDNYATYFQVCPYVAATALDGVGFLYGTCSLPVNGIVCGSVSQGRLERCSHNTNTDELCVVRQPPRNFSHARSLCASKSSSNLESSLNVKRLFKEYLDKKYLLGGYYDLFVFKSLHNGTSCVTLVHEADNLFVQKENCNTKRQYICKEYDLRMDLLFKTLYFIAGVGPFVFAYLVATLIICKKYVGVKFANKPHGNVVPLDESAQLQRDTISISSEDSVNSSPIGSTNNFVLGRMQDVGSVPGRTQDVGSVPGRTQDVGSVPGRTQDVGSVPGRTQDVGSVPGRNNYQYVQSYSSNESDT